MPSDLLDKATRFRELHLRAGAFLMPNPWNAGTARLLAAAGFEALGTTSAGVNYNNGVADNDYAVPRPQMMAEYRRVAEAVEVPVSGDLEAGFGEAPEAVAETIAQSVDCGMVGGSIQDYSGAPARPLYDLERAADRIRAAREAADATGIPYTLTARAECFLIGHSEPFKESVKRLNRYRQAGADCLYAPGIVEPAMIAALVNAVDGPVNVLMGLAGGSLSLGALAALGVKRVSIGGSLARAALTLVRDAAREMRDQGTFGFAEAAIANAEINAFFASNGHTSGIDRDANPAAKKS
jgi:2-methylisocitrate lyase-like PEP mutase family enzyme